MSEDLAAKALALELKKRFVDAGECWEGAGQIEKAIANYHRGGNLKRAIDLALKKGLAKRAADLYVKGEMYDKAAELYRRERDFGAAARALRQAGQLTEAATLFEAAGELGEAARLYESVNDFVRAGELFEKGGDDASSARAYERALDAKMLDRLGGKKDLARVAQVLARVRSFEKAAEVYLQAQEVCEAVLTFVRLGEIEGAAQLLARCQGDQGFEVLARIDFTEPAAPAFARMFYLAHDYGKAAQVFAGLGDQAKAAMLFEKNQDYHQAGAAYLASGDPARAGVMFERAGQHREAAEAWLGAGDRLRAADAFGAAGEFFAAGRLFREAGRDDRALECLQRVPAGAPGGIEAARGVAAILHARGHDDLALARLRSVASLPLGPASLDPAYDLAQLLIEREELDEAERVLNGILAVQYGYKDVAQLLEEVGLRRAAPKAPPPPRPAPAVHAPVTSAGALVSRLEGMEVLAATPLFEDLSLGEMKRFWEIAVLRRFAPGEVLLEEGAEGDGLYVVRRGAVDVVKGAEVLVQLHPGEFFGEMAVIDQSARTSARVVAAADCEVFFLDRAAFNRLLAQDDGTALKMYRVFVGTLATRLRRMTDDLAAARAAL